VSGDSQSSFAAIALWVIARVTRSVMRGLDPRIPILLRSACINEMAGYRRAKRRRSSNGYARP
jgi:hypothetical protein